MYRLLVVWLSMLAVAGPASAGGELMETEGARANARAGGPTNARDAELLERWGCESGTRSAFCQRLEQKQQGVWHRQKKRHPSDY